MKRIKAIWLRQYLLNGTNGKLNNKDIDISIRRKFVCQVYSRLNKYA